MISSQGVHRSCYSCPRESLCVSISVGVALPSVGIWGCAGELVIPAGALSSR